MTPGTHNDDDGNTNDQTHNMANDPTGNTDNTDIELDSGAYVLNALDRAERDRFDAHLAESETTRDEVTELNDVAVLLGLAALPVQPSTQVKANIMAMLASTPQLSRDIPPIRMLQTPTQPGASAVDSAPIEGVPDAAGPAPITAADSSGTTATRKAQARWFNRPALALTAVAAAIALIVGGGAIANVLRDATFQQQQADGLAAITAADDMRQQIAPVSTGGTATLVWSDELGSSALIVDGVAALPSDKTYELWLIDADGNPTKAGLFDVSGSDREWRVLDGTMKTGLTVGVTVEPSGGSDAPTTDPIVAISAI